MDERVNRWMIFVKKIPGVVIDGNLLVFYERRMAEADQIIFLNFSRTELSLSSFQTLFKYRNRTRESMAPELPRKIWLRGITGSLEGRRSDPVARYENRQTFPQYLTVGIKKNWPASYRTKTSEPNDSLVLFDFLLWEEVEA